jgi:hypothetical protein
MHPGLVAAEQDSNLMQQESQILLAWLVSLHANVRFLPGSLPRICGDKKRPFQRPKSVSSKG